MRIWKYLIKRYEAICETIIAMAMVSGSWMKRNHSSIWDDFVQELGSVKTWNGAKIHILELHRFPATLLFYSLGVGALKSNDLTF